jgi:thiamine-phosphate pyrophosphorylase
MCAPAAASLSGLYIILDAQAAGTRPLAEAMAEALAGGARLIQYRAKQASMREAYEQAGPLAASARQHGARFIVNDRCDLALAVGADGVHLGQDDLPLAMARSILGPDRLIGISTHRPEQVVAATVGGADYIGYGPIFTPFSKPDHEAVVGLEGLRAIRGLTALPVFAIGGITLEQVPAVMRAGANGVAVISSLARAADLKRTVEAFIACCSAAGLPAC